MTKKVVIIDFGAPGTHFVAREVRRQRVYSEVYGCQVAGERLRGAAPAGVILVACGGEDYSDRREALLPELLALKVPLLEIDAAPQPLAARLDTQGRPALYSAELLAEFLRGVCACAGEWRLEAWVERSVERLREQIGDEEVVLGLSGGVDSSVVAVLLQRAIGGRLHCIFVDNGLLRYREAEQVERMFGSHYEVDLHVIDAAGTFYEALRGVEEPERKRKIIGHTFIDIFSREARRFRNCKFLGQGTIYPDVIESFAPDGQLAVKSHHNVGGLPPDLQFELVEPLRDLFKDEVREVGRVMGMPDELLMRQPFPGPGLAVRILGEVNAQRVGLLQQADLRLQEELSKLPDYRQLWQSFAVLLPVRAVGVRGGQRSYENVCAIRAVESVDAITATWARLPYETLDRISERIIAEVPGINRVVYDISSKPPATIEWE